MTLTATNRRSDGRSGVVGRQERQVLGRQGRFGPRIASSHSNHYRDRIETLIGYASEDGTRVNDASREDFKYFVDTAVPSKKAMLVIIYNGNFKGIWANRGDELGLEFIGDRLVRFVLFKQMDENGKTYEDYGECSFDAMRIHIREWGLWSMMTS